MTTDQGNTGIAIIDRSGTYSWYTNPRSWTYLLLKPYDWGASVWELIKTEEAVTDGIKIPSHPSVGDERENGKWFDLTGREKVNGQLSNGQLPRGLYIRNRTVIVR